MKNNLYKTLALFPVLILFAASCTERIDIELDSSYSRLVVEGNISTDTMAHTIILSRSTDYYTDQPPPRISNAVVKLDDGVNPSITLVENSFEPGHYQTPADYFGVPGRTYDISVELAEDLNGINQYEAESSLRPVTTIDSIQVVYNVDWEGYEVKIYALDPPSVDFYTFSVLKNGVMLTDTINELGITDDSFYNGNYTNGITVYFLNGEGDEQVIIGDTITLRMSSITEDYFYFIADFLNETFEFRNPLFSGPPANISTNLSEGAVGFFAAYSNAYSSVVYNGETNE
jgi:hypothetical protein